MKKQVFAGKFEIQREISKGQTGTIYYGYDMELRQEVAIKIYHSHINGRLIPGQAFQEKSKHLLLINHPNLIKIFKVEEEDDTPVVFMEFFDAPSLQQMIHDKGPLSVHDMLMVAREITEVLVHTHFQGIIHGTLHPNHILITLQGQIKVLDLGLSWILMDILSDCDEELLRPLPYFPPEIAKGEILNLSSDLYCLGFMMYEMLTGTTPYAGLPKTSIMGQLAFDQTDPGFNFPDEVPEAICDLIRHMTRNKTQQRLQDATHVLTIINQQLPKFASSKDSSFLPPMAPEPQTPAPTEPEEPKKTSTSILITPQPLIQAEPAFNKTPPVQLPQEDKNDDRIPYAKVSWKIGITLGMIIVVGLAGALGYWYRDFLEPHFSMLSTNPEHPSQERPLPQILPGKNTPSVPHAQNSLNEQNPLLETDNLSPMETPSLTPQKTTEGNSLSGPTSDSLETDVQTDQSGITQPPEPQKAKQETSLAPTQQQPAFKQSPTPEFPKKISRKPEITPLSSTKTTSEEPAQKSISQQSATNKALAGQTVDPTQKQPLSSQSIDPIEKRPSKTILTVPEITPLPTTKATKPNPLKSPASLEPTNETINQKNESDSSTPSSSEDNARVPTDEEIEELLQDLDAPLADLPSLTEP